MTDRRRSKWVAFDAHFYDNDLGVGIRERFGPVGLVLFSAFLCACKRNSLPGTFRYSSTPDALNTLGLPGMQLVDEHGAEFTLDAFWTYLGQRKMTRKTRRGRITDITATRWERWQHDLGRQNDAEQKRRSRGENAPTKPRQPGDDASPNKTRQDKDNDISSAPTSGAGGDDLWDALIGACGLTGTTPTPSERGAWNKAVKQIREAGATPAEVSRRVRAYRQMWPNASATPAAIARHWSECVAVLDDVRPERPDCPVCDGRGVVELPDDFVAPCVVCVPNEAEGA